MGFDWKTGKDSKAKYHRYLNSPEWKIKRKAVRKRCGGICERCGLHPMADTHHLTYANKYDEPLEDLQAVCRGCHEFLHELSPFDPKARAVPPPVLSVSELIAARVAKASIVAEDIDFPRLQGRKIKSVYLAGKITGTTWRDDIADGWKHEKHGCGATESSGSWFTQEKAVAVQDHTALTLNGPFWRPWGECGGHCYVERCAIGTHLNGFMGEHGGEWQTNLTDLDRKIRRAIDVSDLVFVWLDCKDCFGTLIEIGYAAAKSKKIVIAVPTKFDAADMWLACIQADRFIVAESPASAWTELWKTPDNPNGYSVSSYGGNDTCACAYDEEQDVYGDDASRDPELWELEPCTLNFERFPELRERLLAFT